MKGFDVIFSLILLLGYVLAAFLLMTYAKNAKAEEPWQFGHIRQPTSYEEQQRMHQEQELRNQRIQIMNQQIQIDQERRRQMFEEDERRRYKPNYWY